MALSKSTWKNIATNNYIVSLHFVPPQILAPMKKPTFFLILVFLNLKFFAQGQPDQWIGIDCGSNVTTSTFQLIWQTDEEFIKSGMNYFIPDDSQQQQALAIFKTLRAFTDQNKNCYTLPRTSSYGYFIRAAFLYANYDGKSLPPTFDIEIDGNKWTSVITSATDYTYYEILYWPQRNNISVCLARTQSDQFPFISSLEAWPIYYGMYTQMMMSKNMAWLKSYRYDYGPTTGILGCLGRDWYNRIWETITIPGTTNTSGGSVFSCDENPPFPAVENGIEAQDSATSLVLSFGPVKTATPIYIEAYFTEMGAVGISDTRAFEMYVAGLSFGTIALSEGVCTTPSGLVQVSNSNLTIELHPTQLSTLPPIISAIEIYTATDPLITTGTDQDDLDGLMSFTDAYERLEGWSGEPCLPADTVWEWVACAATHPPRVTSLYLSGYQLNGPLPNFSQMKALVDIDLSKNNLSGEIPAFLGQLPNLRTLNLSYNDFSGAVPASIRNNRRLKYDVTGNPNLDSSGKDGSSKATIIGLAVGIPLLVAAIILLLVFWLIRKRANHGQSQEAEPETGNGFTTTEQQHIQAPHDDGEDYIEVGAIGTKPNDESMVPDMDLDELEGLIDQYAHDGDHARLPSDDDDDCVAVDSIEASNDESMVPDLDLEELQEIIQQGKERGDELVRPRSDSY